MSRKKLTARIFIRSIGAVFLTVAEEASLNAIAIAAREKTVLTERLIGDQQWLHFALFALDLAVLHRCLPVACLLFDVEEQTGWTTDGLEALLVKRNKK